VHLDHGLYWQPSWPDVGLDELYARQALLPESAAFSHLTAARIYGWWLPSPIEHPVFVAQSTEDPRARRAGMFVCRHPRAFAIHVESGVRLTTPAETILSCARDLGVLDLVIVGDSALREGHCTVPELRRSDGRRRRGAPLLRTVIPLLDARSESPWESVMRVLHLAADLPVIPQFEIFDKGGRFVARADLRVAGTNRLHEYDGAGHRDAATHAADLLRERRLIDAGWQRVGFTSTALLRESVDIIAGTDLALGRDDDPRRQAAWDGLVQRSLFTPWWRERARRRWARTRPAAEPPRQVVKADIGPRRVAGGL
jgi:hypothetical protein